MALGQSWMGRPVYICSSFAWGSRRPSGRLCVQASTRADPPARGPPCGRRAPSVLLQDGGAVGGKFGYARPGREGPTGTHGGGGAGLRGPLVQSGRSECGREFVRRACSRRFPACGPAPPRFEWRAARLQLCPGDECLKGRRSGGVPGGQARGAEAAPSLRYPSGVGRLTFTKVRLQSRAEGPSRGWKEAGLGAGRGPAWGQGLRRSRQPRGPSRRCPARPATGSAHAS